MKGVRSFLGHVSFYQRFIKDLSKIAKPLCNLPGKENDINFDADCLKYFSTIKDKLVTPPITISTNWELLIELICYASDYSVEAVLGQYPKNFSMQFSTLVKF